MPIPAKNRNYSVVIHQAKAEDQEYWYNIVRTYNPVPSEFVVSVEPYNDKPGYHVHIFVIFKNCISWFKLLKMLQDRQIGHICNKHPQPPGKILGHIKLKQMVGTMAQATAYLTQDLTQKDKVCGKPKVFKNGIKCTNCKDVFPLYYMETNSYRKTGLCKPCWAKLELQEIYSRQYSCHLEFKATLDDFQHKLDCIGFPATEA